MKNKVVIIGCGNVGMSYAYALLNQKTAVQELALIDLNMERVKGEVMDLNHCLAFAPSKINIKCGTYEDCQNADMVVICAGANQNKGETRLDLISKNKVIFHDIIEKVMDNNFKGIFLIATNPLDIMTYITWKESGVPINRVIGSGTSLDTARLRFLLGDRLNINPKNVHAYVIGEHGDSEFVAWNNATVGLQPVSSYLSDRELDDIYVNVRDAAYDIIARKGATCYGIGMCLVRITNAILNDENTIITVSSYDDKNDLFIGWPSIINCDGIRERTDMSLNSDELHKYKMSVEVIKEVIASLK